MSARPTGTVTFLFTDIEGSTRLWEERPDDMRAALAEHDAIVRSAIDTHGGYVFSTGGDGFAAAFQRAADAVAAAEVAQAALAGHPLLKVRMGIHTGEVQERDGDYFGPAVNRTARIMAAGHGGQTLVSDITAQLVPAGTHLRDLGEHRLRDLSTPVRVWQIGSPEFAPLRTLDRHPTNLPIQATSFVGREIETQRLVELIGRERLVTISGPGGVGKTRLALQVAADSLNGFPDGVWFCDLTRVDDPDRVVDVVAEVLGLAQGQQPALVDVVAPHLREKRTLLLLDNCEHVVDGAYDLAERLLAACRHLVVLCTSREGLGSPAEHVVAIPPLPTAKGGADDTLPAAAELFVERARSVKSDFVVDQSTRDAVLRICRRLDGMPLALELAAARVRSLAPAQIADRLDERFSLLRGGRRGAERHRTLSAVVDWSYDALDDAARRVFDRLSIFVNGCSLPAATAVCADGRDVEELNVLDRLDELVSKSMVIADTSGAEVRYRLLETLRSYGHDRLMATGGIDGTRRRHTRYYCGYSATLDTGLRGPDAFNWIKPAVDEIDNIRTALFTAADAADIADLDLALDAATHCDLIVNFAQTGGIDRANAAIAHAALDRVPSHGRACARWNTATGLMNAGRLDDADALIELAIADFEASGSVPAGFGCATAVGIAMWRGDTELARRRIEWALQRVAVLSDDFDRTVVLGTLGLMLAYSGEAARGGEALRAARAAAERSRNPFALIEVTGYEGTLDLIEGRLGEAIRKLESVVVSSSFYPAFEKVFRRSLGRAYIAVSRHADAAAQFERSLQVALDTGDTMMEQASYFNAPELLIAAGRPDVAAYFVGAVARSLSWIAGSGSHLYSQLWREADAEVRRLLGDEAAAAAEAGRNATLDDLRATLRRELRALQEQPS